MKKIVLAALALTVLSVAAISATPANAKNTTSQGHGVKCWYVLNQITGVYEGYCGKKGA